MELQPACVCTCSGHAAACCIVRFLMRRATANVAMHAARDRKEAASFQGSPTYHLQLAARRTHLCT